MFRKAWIILTIFVFVMIVPAISAQEASCDESDLRASIEQVIERGFNRGDLAVVDEAFAEAYIRHPDDGSRETFKATIQALRNAMPEGEATIKHHAVEGCDVFFEFTFQGTLENALQLPGQEALGPTGQPLIITSHVYLRFNELGQTIEEWDYTDSFSLLAQTGVIPVPEGEAEATEEAILEEMTATSGNEARNAEMIRRSYEEGNSNADVELLRQHYSVDYIGHSVDGSLVTLEEFLTNIVAVKSALPDLKFTVNDTVAQGNTVAARVTLTGTFQNELVLGGQEAIPPTGQPVRLEMSFVHLVDNNGLILEDWEIYDQLSLFIQLGLVEAPA
jgi:predicted ester cyclase